MSNTIRFVSMVGCVALLVACGKKDKDNKGGQPPPPAPVAKDKLPAPPAPEPIQVKGVGFKTPESVLYDSDADIYLVSNINGSPLEADGNGFVSQLSPDGKVVALTWIDGAAEGVTLNAPKGMAISGDLLYVSDLTFVRMFDRKTGAPKGEVEIKGSSFLNDVAAADGGGVYVSDTGVKGGKDGFVPTGTDAVYKIGADRNVTTIAKTKELGRPNGLVADGDGVLVVTFGSGELYRLSADGKRTGVVKPDKGQLDGIVRLAKGGFLISSWEGALVYRGPAAGPFEVAVSGVKAPADIGYDAKRNRVIVPLFQDDGVLIHPLK